MKVSGSVTLQAPPEAVWAALNDPAVLVHTIPGCERLVADGPGSYQLTVTAGVASVRGTYTGQVSLSRQQPPSSFLMEARGAGGPGTISTTVAVSLAGDGESATLLSYDADAVVGGVIAGVGQRMLTSVAKRMAGEFFTAVDGVLAAGPERTGAGAAAGPSAAHPPSRALPRPRAGAAGVPAATATASQGSFPEAGPGDRGTVWEAPRAVARGVAPGGGGVRTFVAGTVAGAVIALTGAVVGGLISGRRS